LLLLLLLLLLPLLLLPPLPLLLLLPLYLIWQPRKFLSIGPPPGGELQFAREASARTRCRRRMSIDEKILTGCGVTCA
jgi:hypothetical protein